MTIAWLSGSSDPARSALSPAERRLLDALAGDRSVIGSNFPWPEAPGEHRPTPLLVASLRNGIQFWRARLSRRYRRFIADRVGGLLASRQGELLIVTGSQGLELVRLAWPLTGSDAERIRVISLGPVAGRLPVDLRAFVVRASGDLVWRLGWRGSVDLQTTGGHLDYVDDPSLTTRLLAAARG